MSPKTPKTFKDIRPCFTPHTTEQVASTKKFEYPITEWLDHFHAIITKKNIKLILLYGTCLGIYRDKALIENDTDADYGIFIEELPHLHSCVPELLENGFHISGRGQFQISFKFPHHDFYIDIWPIKKIKNPLFTLFGYKWLCDHIYFKKNYFSTPTPVQFDNKTYYLPTPCDHYLEQVYGPTWKTPIKNQFSGPRGLLSQLTNTLFVNFDIPTQFSGDNSLGTWKPWASKVLKTCCPKAKITHLFKHPN